MCVQVYDMEGRYRRAFGETFLNSASGLPSHQVSDHDAQVVDITP